MVEVEWLAEPSAAELGAVAELRAAFWDEVIPGEPPAPPSALAVELAHPVPHKGLRLAVARHDGAVAGFTLASLPGADGQRHVVWVELLVVAPTLRRQGIGSALLDAVVAAARADGRSRITTHVAISHDAGAAFAAARGGRPEQLVEQNRAPVATMDRGLLQSWVDRAGERAEGYSLVGFDGVCPDEWLERFARVIPVMNTAPHTDEQLDVRPTPDVVRASQEAYGRQGHVGWTVCALHEASGELVGYTELGFSPHRPWLAIQGDTGVHPDHRERGLGRWLKGVNALRMLDERPEVTHVETWNAGENDAMLSINRAMGFAPVAEWREWVVTP